MTDRSDRLGKRERSTRDRNKLITTTAMALARRRKWPSPRAIAEKANISESVVERETALLTEARREWVRLEGRDHPQWRDPDRPIAEATSAAGNADGTVAPQDGVAGEDGAAETTEPDSSGESGADTRLKRARATIARQGRTIEALKDKVETLEEQVRRVLAGIRPPELDVILATGAAKRAKGKSKKRVGVGT